MIKKPLNLISISPLCLGLSIGGDVFAGNKIRKGVNKKAEIYIENGNKKEDEKVENKISYEKKDEKKNIENKISEEQVDECPICFADFKNLVAVELTCDKRHKFCFNCSKKLDNDCEIKCPLCRKVSQTKKEDSAKPINIFIKGLDGTTLSLKVDLERTTVFDLKKLIQKMNGIPPDQNRLIWRSRELDNNNYLGNYNMQRDETLHSAINLRGN